MTKLFLLLFLTGVAMADEHPELGAPTTLSGDTTMYTFGDHKGPYYITFNGKNGVIARINMDTGDVELTGDPNESAKLFWQYLQSYGRGLFAENERLKALCAASAKETK